MGRDSGGWVEILVGVKRYWWMCRDTGGCVEILVDG